MKFRLISVRHISFRIKKNPSRLEKIYRQSLRESQVTIEVYWRRDIATLNLLDRIAALRSP